jgi:polysaccharide export outer membrane protein
MRSLYALLSLVLLLLAGPASAQDDYRIGAGDVLSVQVYGEPTLSADYAVGEQGALAFPLIGPVQVLGLTPDQVAAALIERLSPGYLVDANVTVWVARFGSQPVQVLGAVGKPGVYYLRGPTSLLQLLGEAGGVTGDGVSEIRVTRAEDGHEERIAYETLVASEGVLKLAPGDVVFVPEALISVMGEVGKPGEIDWREGMTVSQGIAAAGGLTEAGATRRVMVLRGDEQVRVNLRAVLAGEDEDLLLEPGDRVFVKRAIF